MAKMHFVLADILFSRFAIVVCSLCKYLHPIYLLFWCISKTFDGTFCIVNLGDMAMQHPFASVYSAQFA